MLYHGSENWPLAYNRVVKENGPKSPRRSLYKIYTRAPRTG